MKAGFGAQVLRALSQKRSLVVTSPSQSSMIFEMHDLYLLRHAKSSWDDPALADFERPLAARGRKAARRLATHIARAGVAPELVLCSPAQRARETLDGIRTALDRPLRVEYVDELYGATAETITRALRALPEKISAAMVVAHNPGLGDLAATLAPDGESGARMRAKFPTGGLATFRLDCRWNDLGPGRGQLIEFVVPRELG